MTSPGGSRSPDKGAWLIIYWNQGKTKKFNYLELKSVLVQF